MKLLLLSGGLITEQIKEAFQKNIPKLPHETKVIFIGTDTTSPGYRNAIQITKQILNEIKIKNENIHIFNLHEETPPNLKNYNVIIMLPGNPSEYMQRIRELGLIELLNQFIEEDGFYVGASAGAVITGPIIDVTSVGEHETGFGWVDFIVVPHLSNRDNTEKQYDYHRKTGCKMIYITDQQAILVQDDMYKII